MDASKTPTGGSPEAIAIDFLKNSPTFKFDGIETSIQVKDNYVLKTSSEVYIFEIGFTCASSGYGDRSDMMVAQVLTNHTILIKVAGGKVVSAIIDGSWNELTQSDVELIAEEPAVVYITPEAARDSVINYIITTYGLNLETPTRWSVRDATTEGLLGYQTLVYTSGDWMVNVKHAVVLSPVYSIHVEYTGVKGFTWSGSVKIQMFIEESENTIQNEEPIIYYSVENARDLAVKFILGKHPEVGVPFPGEWTETNLVPEGLVGATKVQYTGAGWTVIVSAPVVWKPTYTISVDYSGATNFKWSGILPTGGEIAETSFS